MFNLGMKIMWRQKEEGWEMVVDGGEGKRRVGASDDI